MRQAPPTPGPRVSLSAAAIRPAARPRQAPPHLPSSARQFPPYSHAHVSYYFLSATTILIRASATIPLPRVRYPPPPSARQQVRPSVSVVSTTPDPRVSLSARRQLLFALPRVNHPLTRSARQLLSPLPRVRRRVLSHLRQPFRTSSASLFALPRVRYRLTPDLLSPLPRVRYPPSPSAGAPQRER